MWEVLGYSGRGVAGAMKPKYGRGGRKRRNRRARRGAQQCPQSHIPTAKTVESMLNAEFGPIQSLEEHLKQ